jgi:hypothetical protein
MRVYSEAIFQFIYKCEKYTKEILSHEMGVEVFRSRFLFRGVLYPIHIVVTDSQKTLGTFNPNNLQIALNKKLLYEAKDVVLKNIIRHELAHYYFYLLGHSGTAHGEDFKKICQQFHWDENVMKATASIEIENEEIVGPLVDEKILNKIKNLFKLATSENPHEAELATLKANQLLIKHNIDKLNLNQESETYVMTLMTVKKRNQKIITIYEIIKHFLVSPILSYQKSGVSLEIFGTRENIELSTYVFDFLNSKLDELWLEEKALHGHGIRAKNSFFMGIARGYDEKTQTLMKSFHVNEQNSLVLLKNQLQAEFNKVFKNVSGSTQNNKLNNEAFTKGQLKGKSLSIHPAIKNSKTRSLLT